MPNQTETSSSVEPDPDSATRHRHGRLARLWDSGIPLWQKLLVWAGAFGVAWTTVRGLALAWILQEGIMPVEPIPPASDARIYGWFATGLALSAGLWLWPLARGRWRALTQVLAVPATLAFLIFSPMLRVSWDMSLDYAIRNTVAGAPVWLDVIMPLLVYPALVIVWIRAFRDFRAARREGRNRPTD